MVVRGDHGTIGDGSGEDGTDYDGGDVNGSKGWSW